MSFFEIKKFLSLGLLNFFEMSNFEFPDTMYFLYIKIHLIFVSSTYTIFNEPKRYLLKQKLDN